MPEFKFIERGFQKTAVLIPGWATDYRIFAHLDLGYNYLLPADFQPSNFERSLIGELERRKTGKICLFGWSLGGFCAARFASANPGRVEELVLLSIREKYDNAILKNMSAALKKNKNACLYKFYLDCFCPEEKEIFSRLKEGLLKDYISGLSLESLLRGLDYLAQARVDTVNLSGIRKIRVFHGREDRIAPFNEALTVSAGIKNARYACLEHTGHIPFLNPGFKEIFENA